MLDGLRDYWKMGLDPPKEVLEATQEYRDDMDIVGRWMEEHCIEAADAEEKIADLYADYQSWSRNEIGFSMSVIAFGRELADNRGLEKKKVKGARGIRGLKLDPNRWIGTSTLGSTTSGSTNYEDRYAGCGSHFDDRYRA
jgi:putative DNA primase/helicase